jgi:hypothetical protein
MALTPAKQDALNPAVKDKTPTKEKNDARGPARVVFFFPLEIQPLNA